MPLKRASFAEQLFLKNCIESNFSDIRIAKIYTGNNISSIDTTLYRMVINSSVLKSGEHINISKEFTDVDIAKLTQYKYTLQKCEKIRYWNLFKHNLFLFHNYMEENQSSLISKYSLFLLNSDFVKDTFIEGVQNRVKKSNTYVGNGVAVVHGYREDCIKPGIVIVIQDNAVVWNGQNMEILFLISLTKETPEYQLFFRDIIRLVSDVNKIELLKKCNCIENILDLL